MLDLGEPSISQSRFPFDFKVNVTFFSAYDFGREYDSVVSAVPGSKDYLLLSSPAQLCQTLCSVWAEMLPGDPWPSGGHEAGPQPPLSREAVSLFVLVLNRSHLETLILRSPSNLEDKQSQNRLLQR